MRKYEKIQEFTFKYQPVYLRKKDDDAKKNVRLWLIANK